MSARESADVVVIGAGAMGCSIAFHLARAGVRSVAVLDKGGICSGMTYRSGALVRLHYTNEHEARIALCAYRYFHEWSEIVGGDCGFVQTGFLMVVGAEDVERLRLNVAALRALGVDITADTVVGGGIEALCEPTTSSTAGTRVRPSGCWPACAPGCR